MTSLPVSAPEPSPPRGGLLTCPRSLAVLSPHLFGPSHPLSRPDPCTPPVCGLLPHAPTEDSGVRGPACGHRGVSECLAPLAREQALSCCQRRAQCYFPGFSLGTSFCDFAFAEPAQVQRGCRASREPGRAVGAADAAGIPGSRPISSPVHPMTPSGRPVFSDSGEMAHLGL